MVMDAFNFQVRGLKQLNRTLEQLPAKLERGAVRSGTRAGGAEIRDEIRQRTRSRKIRKAVAVQPRRGKPGLYRVTVGIRTTGRNRAPHAHLVEFGTGPRRQKTTGRYTGIMPARPFFVPGVEASDQDAVAALVRKVQDYVRTRL